VSNGTKGTFDFDIYQSGKRRRRTNCKKFKQMGQGWTTKIDLVRRALLSLDI
jgi:hypothetical protein